MEILLQEKILETQICSICKQYLSYGPIKVDLEQGTKCGRCDKKQDREALSFMNKIVSNFIFPCVNRFEGCNQLLRFQDVPEHEKTCIGSVQECPLCPEDKYMPNTLLYLINHYKIFHNKYYLTEPNFLIDADTCGENCYLFCDKSENILVIIFVRSVGTQLYINVSTVGTGMSKIKYKIKLYEVGCQKYESATRFCSTIGVNFDCIEVKPNLSLEDHSTLCVLELYTLDAESRALVIHKQKCFISQPNRKMTEKLEGCKDSVINRKKKQKTNVEDYGELPNLDPHLVKIMPEIYVSEDCKSKHGVVTMREVTNIGGTSQGSWNVPSDFLGDITVLIRNTFLRQHTINTVCHFCENYYSSFGSYQEVYKCEAGHIFICGTCYNNGITRCKNDCSLDGSLNSTNSDLLYYCRFGCEQFFKASQLPMHERRCALNKEASLTDLEFAKQHFADYFVEGSVNSKSVVVHNNVVVFNRYRFGDKGKIYMVTDYEFQCIIFYETDKNAQRINFWVIHRYPLDQCYILFKIRYGGKLYEEPNSFYIDSDSMNRLLFAVFVRKLQKK